MSSGDLQHREIEVRFLDINVATLIEKLRAVGAVDLGEDFLREIIFYDEAGRWQYEGKKFARLRQTKNGITLTFKDQSVETATGTVEIEFTVSDLTKAKAFLEALGLVAFREQEKKRHTFKLVDVIVDIDTWPKIPTYIELEGGSEDALKKTAKTLGLDWKDVIFEAPRYIIERRYGIPVSKLHQFTFSRIE